MIKYTIIDSISCLICFVDLVRLHGIVSSHFYPACACAKGLGNWFCPSVGLSVCQSVSLSICQSVSLSGEKF